ncbi:MAG: hypothetical protein AAB936_00790 [Patescibacteria group bacterium]
MGSPERKKAGVENLGDKLKEAIASHGNTEEREGITSADMESNQESKERAFQRMIKRQKAFTEKLEKDGQTFHAKDPVIWALIRNANATKNRGGDKKED